MTTIDFGKAIQDAKGASFEALPVGDYDVEVHKTDAVTSSNGKPMIKTTMRVINGPYEKRPVITQFVLSLDNPQAVAIFFRHMKAFGLDEKYFASLGQVQNLDAVASALMNRRARITVGHREWQGEMRNEVKAVKPYTGAPPQMAPAGPTGPGGPAGYGPPIGGPTAPTSAPIPAPAPQPAPVQPPAQVAPPQVQSTPQPPPAPPVPAPAPAAPTEAAPVAVPTTTASATDVPGGFEANGSTPTDPATATSDVGAQPAPPVPPALPV